MIQGKAQTISSSHRPLEPSDLRNGINNRPEALGISATNQGVREVPEVLRAGSRKLWQASFLPTVAALPKQGLLASLPYDSTLLAHALWSLPTMTHSWH